MAFRFSWKFFNTNDLYENCKEAMTQSIAKSKQPPEISEPLKVIDINFGDTPPELVLHSLPEVGIQRAHLVFKLRYAGEARLTLKSRVQANQLKTLLGARDDFPEFVRPGIVGAQSGLLLPFIIRLYQVQLDTLVDVIYTKRGVVVTFRNDPVKSVNATSSLDVIPGVSGLIDGTIKTALAETFEEDVPEAVFKASSPTQEFPHPAFGARRAIHQYTKHTKFLELGLKVHKQDCRPYNSLSLGARVEHSIPSRVCLRPHKKTKSIQNQVSVQDLLEISPSSDDTLVDSLLPDTAEAVAAAAASTAATSPARHRPNRRVIKLRATQLEPNPPQTPPHTLSAQAPPSPVFESTPNASPLRMRRRHSIPAPITDEAPFKIRTASLQPDLRPALYLFKDQQTE